MSSSNSVFFDLNAQYEINSKSGNNKNNNNNNDSDNDNSSD